MPTTRWQFVGALAYLLPYVELETIHRHLHVCMDARVGVPPQGPPGHEDSRAWWTYRGANEDWDMAQTPIKVFRCPADNQDRDLSQGVLISISHHEDRAGGLYLRGNLPQGRTNYAGVAGGNGRTALLRDPSCGGANLRQYEGLFGNRTEHPLSQIPDGASNTLLFGEGVGGSGTEPDFAWSWIGVGGISTKFGLGQAGARSGEANQPGSIWCNFSSRHAGGVNFCFADGSVRMLRFGSTTVRSPFYPPYPPTPSADWWVLQRLAGFRDGQTVGADEL